MSTKPISRIKLFKGPLASLMTTVLFAGLISGPVQANEISVEIDQAALIHLNKPGAEIIIGNPSIADISVRNSRLLVLTGKSAGLTNLMVLDGAGKLTYSKKVFVSADTKYLVTLNKGAARQTYSCSPDCSPTLIPGDAESFFEPLAKEIRNKIGLAQSAVDGTTAQQ